MTDRYFTPLPISFPLSSALINRRLAELGAALWGLSTNELDWTERAHIPTPPAGFWGLYAGSDGFYEEDSAGNITRLSSTGDTADIVQLVPRTAIGSTLASFNIAIPAGNYQHLLLVLGLRGTGTTTVREARMRFNLDATAGNYYANDAELSDDLHALASSGAGYIKINMGAASAPTGYLSHYLLLLPDYKNLTLPKHCLWFGYNAIANTTTNLFAAVGGGTWKGTAAIAQVNFTNPSSGSYHANTFYEVWGLL